MDAITTAVGFLASPTYWVVVISVVGIAAVASAIPGMNSFLVMALAFPFILFEIEEPAIGLVALATISGVSNTLDSIPAVLLGQPSAATQVTFLEGHQLARRGRAAHTLGAVYAVSALGGVVGAVLLTIAIPVARPFVLKFGFSEIAATGTIGIVMVTVLSRGAMVKGLIAAVVGMLLGIVGSFGRLTLDPFGAVPFIPFRLVSLPLIPFILGLFALPELVDLMVSRRPVAAAGADVSRSEVLRGLRYGFSRWPMTIRQSAIGVFLGAIPGVGSAVVDWLSYALGIMFTKDKSEFGKGSLDGVLFAESAQNAKEAGAALPTLALGVPGAPTWALVVTAMIPYGVAPGPEMLGSNAHITILLVITLAIANFMISGLGIAITGPLSRLTTIPYPIIGSAIIPIMLLSAFVDTTGWKGIQVALAIGLIGLVMKRYRWPRPPMILGFILVPIIEQQYFNSVNIYGHFGSLSRPLTAAILVIAVIIGGLLLRSLSQMQTDQSPAEATSSPPTAQRVSLLASVLRPQVLLPLLLIMFGAAAVADEIRNTPPLVRWDTFQAWLGLILIGLASLEMWRGWRGNQVSSSIMDLGLLSSGTEGARGAAYKVLVLFAMFLLVGTTLSLKWGALVFALAGPLLLLKGYGRWPLAIGTFLFVYIFIWLLLENVLFMIYPEPFIGKWLSEVFRNGS